jgi:hypothetical protein
LLWRRTKQDTGPYQQAQNVGWFKTSQPPQEVLPAANLRRTQKIRGRKRYSENESADHKEQFDAAACSTWRHCRVESWVATVLSDSGSAQMKQITDDGNKTQAINLGINRFDW